MKFFIDIDLALETEAKVKAFANKIGLKVEIIDLNGPGGGWPYVAFIGERKKLITALEGFEDLQPRPLSELPAVKAAYDKNWRNRK